MSNKKLVNYDAGLPSHTVIEINNSYKALRETSDHATSDGGIKKQKESIINFREKINEVSQRVIGAESHLKELKKIEAVLRQELDRHEDSINKSIQEQTFGVSGNKRSRSRSRSRDREEEYPKEERNLVEKVAHLVARVRHQKYMRKKTGNHNLTVSRRQFNKEPNLNRYYNPNPKKGGRTRKK